MLMAYLVIFGAVGGAVRGGLAEQPEPMTLTNALREARYIRSDKPFALRGPQQPPQMAGYHPGLGAPGEQHIAHRQFSGPPPQHQHQQQQHQHPGAFPMHLHPGQSGEVVIKRPQGEAPAFVVAGYQSAQGGGGFGGPGGSSGPGGPARLYQPQPPNRPHPKQQQQQQPHPPHQRPPAQRPQPQHHNPRPAPQHPSIHRPPQSAAKKQPPPPPPPPQIRHNAGPPQFPRSKQPLHSSSKEFRASQPIPSFEKHAHLLTNDEPFYAHLRPGAHGPAGASSSKFYTFESGDNFVSADSAGGASDENSWQPAFGSAAAYPQHTTSAEIQQYQTQERISFYPDVHPEYFQQATGGKQVGKLVKHSSIEAGVDGKRKKVAHGGRRRVPVQTTSSPTTPFAGDADDFAADYVRLHSAANQNIRPIYEFQPEDVVRPTKRHDDPDVVVSAGGNQADVEDNLYQSVAVSTMLQTTAADGDDTDDTGFSLYITPAKPDAAERQRQTTFSTAVFGSRHRPTTPVPAELPATSAPPAAATSPKRAPPPPRRQHNNRVFKRKFVPPPAADADSCMGSCLSNIVSRVTDPVCGSDERTYENIGRLRCTKLCGDQHLHVAHFGNCESSTNELN